MQTAPIEQPLASPLLNPTSPAYIKLAQETTRPKIETISWIASQRDMAEGENAEHDTPVESVDGDVKSPDYTENLVTMEDNDKDDKQPQSATTEEPTDKSQPEEHESETQPTDNGEMEDGPIHSQKIATTDMVDMSLEDGERSHDGMQAPADAQTDVADSKPIKSPTLNVLDTAPTLQPGNAGLGLTESPISPGKSDNGEQIVQSPPAVEEQDRPQVPGRTISEGISRKMTGTFSWLSRATNIRKNTASPPRQNQPSFPGFAARRSTTSSVSTVASHQDKALPPIKDGQESARGPSLQERFQAARMESESRRSSSDTTPPANGEPMKSPTSEYGPGGPTSPQPQDQQNRSRAATTVDMKLPPGTAAGISMGPSTEDDSHVNWDLWQTLVYEGPSAVAKTSGSQLNSAIQNGIPAPIRGVVWQVLADSKSEHLETVYRNLLGKEDTSGIKSPALSRGDSTTQMNGEKQESLASSASSVHSHTSTPATSTHATSPPPTTSEHMNDDEDKNQDTPVPEKRKKSADQTASIQKLEKMIRKDLGSRTAYSRYLASSGLQDGLFGVCKAYALYDAEIGYAQGMNFIAMPLLFNMPEEEAFTLLIRMMSKYDLRSLFTPEMTGLHLRLYQFERLLEDHEPALYCHLHRRGVSPTLYATQWFLTLFAYRFPLQLVQRIYDLILSEGLSAILKFGIVLMKKNAPTLLGMKDMSALTTHLKERLFDVYIDKSPSASSILDSGFFGGLTGGGDKEIYHADALVRDACAIDINEKTLTQYATDFETKTKEEKAREEELETLRTTNTTLSSKLRNLEARVQQQDNDHVGIASELIKTKVENESLADQNESLKMQVDELRKVVEAQPGEVEERLKEEMNRIMSRNMEVQNQNRALEDQMAEMEQELVGTKMKFAELNADYETQKQKMATIQQMLGGAAGAVSPTGSGR
ncbi:Rab-GTPase-TBC domain-containing protein 4 [Elsinoe fawcettii]|nr:Rab-GTPase-TBC domain-containing protein 4 [Elsinoe fawcettii]